MALPNSAAAGVTITNTPTVIYQPGTNPPARSIRIANRSTSGHNLLINISGIHKTGEYEGMEPSTIAREWRASNASIGTVSVQADASTCLIDFGISEV